MLFRNKMNSFNKKSLSKEEQIDLLIERGLIIEDKDSAINLIKKLGYYRLSAYMRLFQTGDDHKFLNNVYFKNIIDLYFFDEKLRLICFEAIQKIEIAYRAHISNIMCHKYDSHWFMDKKTLKDESKVIEIKDLIISEIQKKNGEYAETFIAKYYEKYSNPELPPFWMFIETFTIGSLNRLYQMINWKDKRDIIASIGFKEDVKFITDANWLYSLCIIRNICAHHSRLFNRVFKIKPSKHQKIIEFDNDLNSSFYYIAMIINYYLMTLDNDNSFERNLKELFSSFKEIDKTQMGFPKDWKNFTITKYTKISKKSLIVNKE